MTTLFGRRVLLRPLEAADFPKWQEVRRRNGEWLTKWEPVRMPGQPDVVEDDQAFGVRCAARNRERQLGTGYVPEAFVVAARFVFEELHLHRVQAAIVPRNAASRRVVEKLKLRDEGTAERYLEIDGVWEDHIRYAMTSEEWEARGEELMTEWIGH